MSTLETNLIQPATGTALQVGASGDTITIPSGATFNVAGTVGTGFTQGITEFDSWRLTANYTGSSGVIDGSWERQDTNSENIKLGTGMSQSSGVFTFPSTGIWRIAFWSEFSHSAASNYNGFYLDYSTNSGGAFSYLNGAWGNADAASRISTLGTEAFLNVSNASTYRIRASASGTNNATYDGNTNVNYTYFTFIRLGDST